MVRTAKHLKTARIGYPETSVTNYQPMLRNFPEERKLLFVEIVLYRKPYFPPVKSATVVRSSG
jgi:hypothetical protein